MQYLLHHLLRDSARNHPDRTAVVDGARRLTYAELDESSRQLADTLRTTHGVGLGDRVGIYLEKSLEAIVAIYAVLRSGAAYVPLDPAAPVQRIDLITEDCDLKAVIGEAELTARSKYTGSVISTSRPEEGLGPFESAQDRSSDSSLQRPQIGFDLAYILYTSGSTGRPKGVMLSHQNALGFVDWAAERFEVEAADILSNHAPLHFDLSIFDLFVAAKTGASVVLVPPETSVFPREVARFIDRNEITIWYSVPSILSLLSMRAGIEPGDLPKLRAILFAGEVFPTRYLRDLMQALPHVSFFNLYGPTETNVCTYYEVEGPPRGEEPIPIGRPIDDVETVIVSEEGQEAPAGAIGELWVRGPTVMRGYWGDQEKTERSLLLDPLGRRTKDHFYRTGDLVHHDENGELRLVGRIDSQIKSRGYRIELGEIETAIYSHPLVSECAVVAIPDEMISNRIHAHVALTSDVPEDELVSHCRERIPHYMVPERFVIHVSLPKTSTGKIDRQRLKG